MSFLPQGPWALGALALIAVGLGVILRRGVPKAYGMGVLILALMLLDTAARIFAGQGTAEELGFVADRFFRGEAWWSPLTSVFVHAPPMGGSFFQIHAIGNLLILVSAGPALEDRIGERRFLVVFFVAALVALVAHVVLAYFTPIVSPRSIALGASGGLFGVLTAFAVRYPRERLPLVFWFIFYLPAFVVLLIYLGLNVLYMFSVSNVAWWGHFGGFLAGLAFAYTLPPGKQPFVPGSPAATKGLPDPAKLEPLATTPELRGILDRIRQFTPETRTTDDAHYVDAWLDKFFAKATCEQGHAFARRGLEATCAAGESRVEFARKAGP